MYGKLIAFEGIDGVGKDTQLKLLKEKLDSESVKYKAVSFPRHNEPSAYFVDNYLSLNKPYGEAGELDAYQASVFYSLDRYDASFEIKKWLSGENLVIADRYTGSNIGHQGGKLNDEERKKFVDWLMDFEYRVLGIPKPAFSIILWLPIEVVQARINSRGRAKDGHEVNADHLKKAQASYLWASKHYPEDFKVVKCFEEERELNPQEVHEKVWKIVKDAIK
ncbi:MAG: hypothetical protein A3F99_02635 [Candidatus Colwellbacteria bacterium RIFCSPLOWO2_12_FULL_43_11]|uniref:Thymidylate kinase n=1 Tax=Candidatus Colwellbacteria bacterium RIFCSPLOWO2_12_FULL_43_11 TaxID=1797693 RepID=A0A1G1Z9H2_9BACT|nr:MAG: hypothetical protein A3F99_02635 [Candidatus Colwellbacteria bacterium RIFCSPLOWO2_12_FULL_43_11]